MRGLHLGRKHSHEVTLPEVIQEGSMSYPVDKRGRIINENAGYQQFELLSGEDSNGELALAVLGVYGASKHLLTSSYDRAPSRLGQGYQNFEVRDGQLIAKNGANEYDLGAWPPEDIRAA